MIIKPLEKDFQVVELGVTQIESTLHPSEYTQENKQKLHMLRAMGHCVGQLVQTAATMPAASAIKLNDHYINQFSFIDDSYGKRIQCFYKNIQAGHYPLFGSRYDCYAHEVPLFMYIECGKYLVILQSGGLDMVGEVDGNTYIYDNKFYSSYFKGDDGTMGTVYINKDDNVEMANGDYTGTVYDKDNYIGTDLSRKTQRYHYPALFAPNEKEVYFQYNVIKKNEALNRNICPNLQEVRIKVDIEWAKKKIKADIVDMFTHHFDPVTLSFT